MYTHFVKTGIMSIEKLIEVMSTNPAKRFGIDLDGDFSVWNLDKQVVIDTNEFLSKGKNTPFTGFRVNGKCKLTVVDGKKVYGYIGFGSLNISASPAEVITSPYLVTLSSTYSANYSNPSSHNYAYSAISTSNGTKPTPISL